MLCAQHCLNALLQRPVFDAAQLADIATQLDALEAEQLSAVEFRRRDTSALNMDDSGFFSVGVMEHALQAFSLRMVRWRSAEMRPFHSNPESTQLAFVLHLDSHWFTIRSFGQHSRYWYNLNSFYQKPQFVGSFYLSELLRAAENERYSVFCIRPTDDSVGEQSFYGTEADEMADAIPPDAHGSSSSSRQAGGGAGDQNEDAELQAALAASLADVPAARNKRRDSADDSPHTPDTRGQLPNASAAGARRRKAKRTSDTDEAASGSSSRPIELADNSLQQDDSFAHRRPPAVAAVVDLLDDEDDADVDPFSIAGAPEASALIGPARDRHYDDEDEALQAALAASMGDTSALERLQDRRASAQAHDEEPAQPTPTDVERIARMRAETKRKEQQPSPAPEPEKSEPEAAADSSQTNGDETEAEEQLTADEMRRRRLARFG